MLLEVRCPLVSIFCREPSTDLLSGSFGGLLCLSARSFQPLHKPSGRLLNQWCWSAVTPERVNFSIRLFLKSFFFLLPCFTLDQRHFDTSVKLFSKSWHQYKRTKENKGENQQAFICNAHLHLRGLKRTDKIRRIRKKSLLSSPQTQIPPAELPLSSTCYTQVCDFRHKGWIWWPRGTCPSVRTQKSGTSSLVPSTAAQTCA